MTTEDNNQYYLLNQTHDQLVSLLARVETLKMLTPDEYNKLINQIGLDNISTFSGNYYDLLNRPYIPLYTSDLNNNSDFVNKAYIDMIQETDIEPLRKTVYDLNTLVEEFKEKLETADINALTSHLNELQTQADSLSDSITTLNEFTIDYKINMENIYDMLEESEGEHDSIEAAFESVRTDINASLQIINDHTTDLALLADAKAKNDEDIESIIKTIQTFLDTVIAIEKMSQFLITEYEKDEDGNVILDDNNEPIVKFKGLYDRMNELENRFNDVALDSFANGDEVRNLIVKVNENIEDIGELKDQVNNNRDEIVELYETFTTYLDSIMTVHSTLITIQEEQKEQRSMYETLRVLLQEIGGTSIWTTISELEIALSSIQEKIEVFEQKIMGINAVDYVTTERYESYIKTAEKAAEVVNLSITNINNNLKTLNSYDHSSYATNDAVESLNNKLDVHIEESTEDINNRLNEMATIEYVNEQIKVLTDISDNVIDTLTTIATIDYVNKKDETILEYIDKSIPVKVSELENDSEYVSYFDLYLKDENGEYLTDEDGNYLMTEYASVNALESAVTNLTDSFNEKIELKANITYVDESINNLSSSLTEAINGKTNTAYVDESINNLSDTLTESINKKANIAYVDESINNLSDTINNTLDSYLLKADVPDMSLYILKTEYDAQIETLLNKIEELETRLAALETPVTDGTETEGTETENPESE